jgi:MFS-type transporter involved in bile tolerance (Atg22 family)
MQSPFWAMPALLFTAGRSGAARGFINGFGNLGGFIGPTLAGWLASTTGDMKYGIYGLVCVLLLGSAVTMMLPKITAGFAKVNAEAQKPAVKV